MKEVKRDEEVCPEYLLFIHLLVALLLYMSYIMTEHNYVSQIVTAGKPQIRCFM